MILTVQDRKRDQRRLSGSSGNEGGQTFERLDACLDEIVPVVPGRR